MKLWNPHYKTLDYWRGFAAMWVMLFHGFGTTYETKLHPLAEVIKSISATGWLGVHIFFVISGYCISTNVYKLTKKNESPLKFLKNRFWRLYPTYWLAFLVTLLLNLISSPFNRTDFWSNFPPSWSAWLGNLLLIQPYLNAPFYVVVYWSLVVELGFYLMVAFLWMLKNCIGQQIAFFIALFLGVISVFVVNDPRLWFINYWSEFICGALVFTNVYAKYYRKFYLQIFSLSLIFILGIMSIWVNFNYQFNQIWFSAIFAIFLSLLYSLDDKLSSIKHIQWLKFIGVISYSLYLLHIPFQGRVISLGSRLFPIESPMMILVQVLGWGTAITISYLFYKFIEEPINNWRLNRKIKPN